MGRICGRCLRSLPKTEFYKSKSRRDGLSFWCKACSRVALSNYRSANRERWRQKDKIYREAYWNKDPKRTWAIVACQSARKRAAKQRLVCDITWQDLIPVCLDNCPVLGIPLAYKRQPGRGIHAGSPTIDRLDNSKGYTRDNVIVVSYRVNRIKNDATLDELRIVLEFYERVVNGGKKMTTDRFTRGVGKHPSIITVMDGDTEITGFGPGIDGASPVGLVNRIVTKLNNSPLAVAAVENDEWGLYRLVMRYATMEARGE